MESVAIIGSTNLTSGGLYTNIEAGILLSGLSAHDEPAKELRSFVNSLRDVGQPHIAKVDASNLEQILSAMPTEVSLWSSSTVVNPRGSDALFGAGVFPSAPPILEISKSDLIGVITQPPPARPSIATPRLIRINSIRGFWKQLSSWDVAASSSPGQIQIPKQFASLFPPLSREVVTPSGATQSDTQIVVRFNQLGRVRRIPDARFIKYEPAAHHPRPNIEYRFTFHRRDINPDLLESSDILVFELLRNDPERCWFNVYHVPRAHPQYDEISSLSSRTFAWLTPRG